MNNSARACCAHGYGFCSFLPARTYRACVVWGWLIMGKPNICMMICRSYGGVASERTLIPGTFVQVLAAQAAGGRFFCYCPYKALLTTCSAPTLPSQRRHGRTAFRVNIPVAGVATSQGVTVGLLAAATFGSAFSHNEGRSAHCPRSPQDEAATCCGPALWCVMVCLRIVVKEPDRSSRGIGYTIEP